MPKLKRFGSRIIDLETIVAAELRDGIVQIHLAGLPIPFRFQSDDAQEVWAAVTALAETVPPADGPANPNDLMAYSVIDLENDADPAT